jgi:phosphatidylserine synthase
MTKTKEELAIGRSNTPSKNTNIDIDIDKKAELLLKFVGAILAILYVLGLLISNIQLMELGVADFSSLRVRNIMTGFLFLFYVALIVGPFIPIAICIARFNIKTNKEKRISFWGCYSLYHAHNITSFYLLVCTQYNVSWWDIGRNR